MRFLLTKEQENLKEPLTILLEKRGHTYGEGGLLITPEFEEENRLFVKREGDTVTIRCREKAHFFRGIGHVLRYLDKEYFEEEETVYMDCLGCMPDCSRNGVPSVKMLKHLTRDMALLGMNELFLYMEDTYEIEEYPYFEAFRGRYTKKELKECDTYGEMFGVELIPCIQTLAHLKTFLRWDASRELRDTAEGLLPEDEKVYGFIDAMLKNLSECIHSRKVHLGMDEAVGLGLGNYLNQHGFVNRLAIMKRHLTKVEVQIPAYLTTHSAKN